MATIQELPFSSRNNGVSRQVDREFPKTARIGLFHLLLDLVESECVAGWHALARELQRIGRIPPIIYEIGKSASIEQAKGDALTALEKLPWDRVYDFCERLHSHLAIEVGYEEQYSYTVTKTRSAVQNYVSDELQRIFLEEELAFEFSEGAVRRRGRKHTVGTTTKAQVVLGDARLANARRHYEKALQFFRKPANPDLENCVKEAVCAVEAAGKALFPAAKANTLGDLAKWLGASAEIDVPKTLIQTITGVYGYRSGGNGIGHGGANGGAATLEVTEYVLAVCASQIIFLFDLAKQQDTEIPF